MLSNGLILLVKIQTNLENDSVVELVSLSLVEQKIIIDSLVQPDNDPDCCATLDVEKCVIAQVGFQCQNFYLGMAVHPCFWSIFLGMAQ